MLEAWFHLPFEKWPVASAASHGALKSLSSGARGQLQAPGRLLGLHPAPPWGLPSVLVSRPAECLPSAFHRTFKEQTYVLQYTFMLARKGSSSSAISVGVAADTRGVSPALPDWRAFSGPRLVPTPLGSSGSQDPTENPCFLPVTFLERNWVSSNNLRLTEKLAVARIVQNTPSPHPMCHVRVNCWHGTPSHPAVPCPGQGCCPMLLRHILGCSDNIVGSNHVQPGTTHCPEPLYLSSSSVRNILRPFSVKTLCL